MDADGRVRKEDKDGNGATHVKDAIPDAWRARAAAILTARKGFRCGPLLDVVDTRRLLFSSHLRERDKMLLSRILCGGVWNGFFLG